jgi:hypothetical protein
VSDVASAALQNKGRSVGPDLFLSIDQANEPGLTVFEPKEPPSARLVTGCGAYIPGPVYTGRFDFKRGW